MVKGHNDTAIASHNQHAHRQPYAKNKNVTHQLLNYKEENGWEKYDVITEAKPHISVGYVPWTRSKSISMREKQYVAYHQSLIMDGKFLFLSFRLELEQVVTWYGDNMKELYNVT